MKNIIFLDFDGVLNCEDGYKGGFCTNDGKYGQLFYPKSKDLVNELIERTESDVVISSTWRLSGLETMQALWKDREMSGKVIDITSIATTTYNNKDSDTGFRGLEIKNWLNRTGFHDIFWSKEEQKKYCEKSGVRNYIIIDDDSDMTYGQRNNFVHVFPSPRNTAGFTKEHLNLGLDILETPLWEYRYQIKE